MLVDCGSPSTIVGVENFRQIKKQYTVMVQSSFEYSQSNKHYEFSCGCKTHSLGKVRFPIYVIDKNMHPHLLHVCVEILNQPRIPFLLGNKSLIRMKGTLSFGDYTLTIDSKDRRLCLLSIRRAQDTSIFNFIHQTLCSPFISIKIGTTVIRMQLKMRRGRQKCGKRISVR